MPHPVAASTSKTPGKATEEINATLARTAEALGDVDRPPVIMSLVIW